MAVPNRNQIVSLSRFPLLCFFLRLHSWFAPPAASFISFALLLIVVFTVLAAVPTVYSVVAVFTLLSCCFRCQFSSLFSSLALPAVTVRHFSSYSLATTSSSPPLSSSSLSTCTYFLSRYFPLFALSSLHP